MKKILLLTALIASFFAANVFAQPNTHISEDGIYEYTDNGAVMAYYGDVLVSIPAEIDGTKIDEVGVMACFDLDISAVWIDEGIELINTSAFEGCNAEYIDISETVKNVGERAFANCAKLTEVALRSEDIILDKDAFTGTGHIQFDIPCTADEKAMAEKISAVKGDDNFSFSYIHMSLAESMVEKDIYGENMIYCEDCGFKASKYMEHITLPFTDVQQDAWYYHFVQTAYEFGIINGKSDTIFDPDAGLTCAEAAKIAAVIHAKGRFDGVEPDFTPIGSSWYDVYVKYCYDNAILEDYVSFDWNENATRAQMAYLFSRCDTTPYYINEVPITDIPDVSDTTPYGYEILDLYNKGIAVGSDEHMTFYPDSQVKRSEAATLISRILCYDMRKELPKG